MEVAAALVSFVGLAGPVAQGLKFLYDYASNVKACPKELKEIQADIIMVEKLIELMIQYEIRTERLNRDDALRRAIGNVENSLKFLKEALLDFREEQNRAKIRGLKFGWKYTNTAKLIERVHRTKTLMVDLQQAVESDVHLETNELARATTMTVGSIENVTKNTDENVKYLREESTETLKVTRSVEQSVERIEGRIEQLLETMCCPTPRSEPDYASDNVAVRYDSTPSSQSSTSSYSNPPFRYSSSLVNSQSSSFTAPSSVSSRQWNTSKPRTVSADFPLAQFQDKTFDFLIACIFAQCNGPYKEKLSCEKARDCLRRYPTAPALAVASEGDLAPYFNGLEAYKNSKKPGFLLKFARAYVRDPPVAGRSKKKKSQAEQERSEVSHLPQVGLLTIDAWRLYCREGFYRQAGLKVEKDAWKQVTPKDERLIAYINFLYAQEEREKVKHNPDRLVEGVQHLLLTH